MSLSKMKSNRASDEFQVLFSPTLSLDGLRRQRDEAKKTMNKYQLAESAAKNEVKKLEADQEDGEIDIGSDKVAHHFHALRLSTAYQCLHEYTGKLLRDALRAFKENGKRPDQTNVELLNKVKERKPTSLEGYDVNRNKKSSRSANLDAPKFKSDFDKYTNQLSFSLTLSLEGLREQEKEAKIALEKYCEEKDKEKQRLDKSEEELKKSPSDGKVKERCRKNRAYYLDATHLYNCHRDIIYVAKKLIRDAEQIFDTKNFEKFAGLKNTSSSDVIPKTFPNPVSKLRGICPEHVHIWLLPGFKSSFTTEEVEDLEELTGRGFFGEGRRVADVINNYVSSTSYALILEKKKMGDLQSLGLDLSDEEMECGVDTEGTSSSSSVVEKSRKRRAEDDMEQNIWEF